MKPLRIHKGEYLIKQNDRVNEAIFIDNGILSVELGDDHGNTKLFDLGKNDHFLGDIFMKNNNQPSPVNIKVKSKFCEVYLINKYDLLTILKDYQEIFHDISRVANENYLRMLKICKKKMKMNEIQKKKVLSRSILQKLSGGTYVIDCKFNQSINNISGSSHFISNEVNDNTVREKFKRKNYNNKDEIIKIINENDYDGKTNFISGYDIIEEVFRDDKKEKNNQNNDNFFKVKSKDIEKHLKNSKNIIQNFNGDLNIYLNNKTIIKNENIIIQKDPNEGFKSNETNERSKNLISFIPKTRKIKMLNTINSNVKNNNDNQICNTNMQRNISDNNHETKMVDLENKSVRKNTVKHKFTNSEFSKLLDDYKSTNHTRKTFKAPTMKPFGNIFNKGVKHHVEDFFSIQQDPKRFIINNLGKFEQKMLCEKKDKIMHLLEKLKAINENCDIKYIITD